MRLVSLSLAWLAALSALGLSAFALVLGATNVNGAFAPHDAALTVGLLYPVPLIVTGLLVSLVLRARPTLTRVVRTTFFLAAVGCGFYGIHWID